MTRRKNIPKIIKFLRHVPADELTLQATRWIPGHPREGRGRGGARGLLKGEGKSGGWEVEVKGQGMGG